ncbi:hypothetical protein MIR68_001035 [Amoeboaphelidium protococcarum]|nr:hypothetical protein MIR68_001035 [Amoeboaphelidium protococcarum]
MHSYIRRILAPLAICLLLFAGHIQANLVALNVGGRFYASSAETLQKSPFFRVWLDRWHRTVDPMFLDQDGTAFRWVLNYLRYDELELGIDYATLSILRRQADFFELPELVLMIEDRMEHEQPLINKIALLEAQQREIQQSYLERVAKCPQSGRFQDVLVDYSNHQDMRRKMASYIPSPQIICQVPFEGNFMMVRLQFGQ